MMIILVFYICSA